MKVLISGSGIYGSSTNMMFLERVNRLNQFKKSVCNVLNESSGFETINTTIDEAEIDEFPTFIGTLATGLTNRVSETMAKSDIFTNTVDMIIRMIDKMIERQHSNLSDVFTSCKLIISTLPKYISPDDNETDRQDKIYALDRLKAKLADVENLMNGIRESGFYLSEADIAKFGESITDDVRQFFNEQDGDKIAMMLAKLPDALESIKDNDPLVKTLLDYIYSKIITHVSALRKFADILEDSDLHEDVVSPIVIKARKRADENISTCPVFKYDVLMELGLDDISNIVMTEAASEVKTKVNQKIKTVSRNIDSKVNRILTDIREARKSRMQDKVMKSTFAASYHLKTILKGTLLAFIPQIGPALALIYIIVKVAVSKDTERKYRAQLLADLEEELRLVQEKVKDADAAGDNKAKYKLMRMEMQLQRAINKIRYGYDTVNK